VILALAALVALLLASCSGGTEVTADGTLRPSPSKGYAATESPSADPSVSPIATPTLEPELRLPPDAPTAFEGDVTAEGPFEELVPPGSEVLGAWFQQAPDGSRAFTGVVWGRGEDPFARELGLVLWERFPEGTTWRATHAFTDAPARGVLGISLAVADLTGDGLDDALTFEQTGGSGACGTWRVIAPVHGGAVAALRRTTCDAGIAIVGTHLELREAVFEPDDAHCCPSAFRTTTLEWDGSAFVETDVQEEPAR
jgi:hypothetical protein